MVAPVAMELRACIVTAHEDGDTQDEIAERFNITQATVSRLLKKFYTEGHLVEHPLNKSMIMRSKYDLFKIQTGPSWFTKDPLSFY